MRRSARERSLVTPAGRRHRAAAAEEDIRTPQQRRQALTWAQRLRRVFDVDVSTCERCGGPARIIACIEDPTIIRRILEHLAARAPPELAPLSA